MATLKELSEKVIAFRDARDWKQFHNPKDVALSLVLEAAEVMEHFQWKNSKEMEEHLKNNKGEIAEELADVMYWVLLMAHDFNIDIADAVKKKLEKTDKKYPVEKAKGKHTKYNKL
jgi:NTP pyrophosphatase (non-canonical NTP hydrolase)